MRDPVALELRAILDECPVPDLRGKAESGRESQVHRLERSRYDESYGRSVLDFLCRTCRRPVKGRSFCSQVCEDAWASDYMEHLNANQ
jgi:hypothetical protein